MNGSSIKDLQHQVSMNDEDIARYQEYIQHQQQPQQQYTQQQMQQDQNNEHIDLDQLAKDISENLNDKKYVDEDTEEDKDGLVLKVPYNLKDPLILFAIYFILSQASVRQLFGKYISYINPDVEGIVSQMGVIIYGIIMVVLFMITKKFL
jgi:hypothetical protein